MHYSFESWASLSSEPEASPEAGSQSFPFSEDLRELEASMAMGLDEGLHGFHESKAHAPDSEAVPGAPETADVPDAVEWEALAKVVADHVLEYLANVGSPLKTELDKFRRQADEYYRDNRAMAVQIQRLISEREQMNHALRSYEWELARYRQLLGNLYFKL